MPPRRRRGEKVVAFNTFGTDEVAKERKPKVITGGNSKGDQAWLEAVAEDLIDVSDEDKPKGFLYDVKLMWKASIDEIEPAFWDEWMPKTGRRCTGPSYIRDERGGYVVDEEWIRLRRPCTANPAIGATVCYRHGAQIPHIQAAAKQRLAEAAEIVAMRLVGLTDIKDENGDPITHKDRIAAMNSTLDRAGIKGGTEVEVTVPGYKQVLEDVFSEER
jgi:hypothetical protein